MSFLDSEDVGFSPSSYRGSSTLRGATTTATAASQPQQVVRPRLQLPREPKLLRACKHCRRVLTERQFMTEGCATCNPHVMDQPERMTRRDMERQTTANFSGYIGIIDSRTSWAARLMGARKVPMGVYAFEIKDPLESTVAAPQDADDGDADGKRDVILPRGEDVALEEDDFGLGGLMEGLGEEDGGEAVTKKSRVEGTQDSLLEGFM